MFCSGILQLVHPTDYQIAMTWIFSWS